MLKLLIVEVVLPFTEIAKEWQLLLYKYMHSFIKSCVPNKESTHSAENSQSIKLCVGNEAKLAVYRSFSFIQQFEWDLNEIEIAWHLDSLT